MAALRDHTGPDKASRPPRLSLRDRHSLLVGTMKVALPALAAAIILVLIVWPQLVPDERNFRLSVSELASEEVENLTMVNPRYRSRDAEDRPFTVIADRAVQESSGADEVDLQAPQADMTLKDGSWVTVTAQHGLYDRKNERLDLRETVRLFHDRGFQFETEIANVDLQAGTAQSDTQVHGQGPEGQIDAQGFRILDKGARIVFTGKSHLTIRESALEGAQ
ncbi:LPS export ABC transporter periplasmic protein LptC [Rhodovibrio salinarum]|uniref:LPS export ABC transporter periplasmic protein LptC n=1 Tax=Rhodovibrio salinarum TaxID=1087 RepID=A0A934QLP7_9PROT|nr:LPS export ABC transporter periplasmic protein LptC [Rhodovibrio salinarum]MBK1698799.1 LPS export ABC transporter periplasmic protein LptC [Rhodovibrio salinarum]